MALLACCKWLVASITVLSPVSASILTPPVLPLIVRNPYLSTWLAKARDPPWTAWPIFWTGEEIGLSIMAFDPETASVYPILGRPQDSLEKQDRNYTIRFPRYLGAQFDASTTNLSYIIPGATRLSLDFMLTVSFLSPITPTSTLRQSIPASYIHVTVQGTSDLAIYLDVNSQWVTGSRSANVDSKLIRPQSGKQGLKSWVVTRKDEQIFTELNDRAEWGTMRVTAPEAVDHACGISTEQRQAFAKHGTLTNSTGSESRGTTADELVFAFATTFTAPRGVEASKSRIWTDHVLFSIAHLQDPVVQYASGEGLAHMSPLWASYFNSADELISFHYNDFHRAHHLVSNYTEQLYQDAISSGGQQYADIVALSARQVMGATSFSGTPKNPLLFLKEISSNGNSQTVDVIFPAAPFFLYTNPRWLTYMLEPLLDHQLSGQYPNNYTMHDLGTHFPNLTGHADGRDEYMPVEECGDMLIMALALVNAMQYETADDSQCLWSSSAMKKTEPQGQLDLFSLSQISMTDGVDFGIDDNFGGHHGKVIAKSWINRSWRLWQQWTGYLVKFSLEPQNQLCTDDFAGELALQSNLALKGIIGIKAMSEIAALAGKEDDSQYYRNISDVYIDHWQKLAISRDDQRVKLAYDWYGSWTTLYSLFANALLCFHPTSGQHSRSVPDTTGSERLQSLVTEDTALTASRVFIPHKLYQMQSDWYLSALQKYGLPLDSRHLYAKSDWQLQAAAVAMPQTRKQIIERIARWVNETGTDRPMSDLYQTEGDGGFPGPNFFARPVVGSHFASLVLERACGGHGADSFV